MARFTIFIPDDLAARLEASLGDVPRSKFIRRALEKALESSGPPAASDAQDVVGRASSAPSRVPKVPSKVEKAPVSVQRPGSSEPLERLKDTGLLRPANSVGPRRPRSGPIEKGR